MKYLIISLSFFLFSTLNQAQDSLDIRLQMKRLGIGIDAAGLTAGPQILYYNSGWIFGFTYGLPNSNIAKDVIKVFERTLYLRAALSFGYITTNNSFWPLYIGTGFAFIDEKDKVLDFEGSGSNFGYTIYLGTRLIELNNPTFSNIGVHLELGYTYWDYSNSVLTKNQSDKKYNYSNFYFSVGACYYIL